MSGQNRSSAVMQQRKSPLDSLDYFPTPPWATRALCEQLGASRLRDMTCDEPACGEGHMARPLAEYFGAVHASDIHDYGCGYDVADFLDQPLFHTAGWRSPEWIITNPPFKASAQFVPRALSLARRGVAMLVRSAWLEGEERYDRLFSQSVTRPAVWYQFVERVLMLEGRLVRVGAIDPKTGKPASTATTYGWAVWYKGIQPADTKLRWIAPCRLRLERQGDYPSYPEGAFV